MDNDQFAAQISEVSTLLSEKLKVHEATLDRQVDKAGRMLPRKVRAEAIYLAHAASLAENPKLMRMIDLPKVDKAHLAVTTWLRTIDPLERRWTRALNFLAVIMFNILLIGGVVIWWLWYQGKV
ncbi:MAG: hypothetical protein NTX73_12175 [Rhodobacterales bacterium]|nr:hypothetical protein [Rhodobacterales bacterium]